jgi:hypothetical protein
VAHVKYVRLSLLIPFSAGAAFNIFVQKTNELLRLICIFNSGGKTDATNNNNNICNEQQNNENHRQQEEQQNEWQQLCCQKYQRTLTVTQIFIFRL